MAAVVSLMAKDKGGPTIRFQALMWPVTNADFDTASYLEFADGYFLTRNMMMWFWDSYLSDRARRGDKYASPLQAPTASAGLAARPDPDRAQRRIARRRRGLCPQAQSGRGRGDLSVRYNGLIHDWGLLNPIATVPEVRTEITQVGSELKKRLK